MIKRYGHPQVRAAPVSGMVRQPEIDARSGGSTDTEQNYKDFAGCEENRNDNYIEKDDKETNETALNDNESAGDRERNFDFDKQFAMGRLSQLSNKSFTESVKSSRSEKSVKSKRTVKTDSNCSSLKGGKAKLQLTVDLENNLDSHVVGEIRSPPQTTRLQKQTTNFDVDDTVPSEDTRPLPSNKARKGSVSSGSQAVETDSKVVKLPAVQTCEHMVGNISARDSKANKRSKLKKDVIEEDKCMICETTESSTQQASAERARLLMESVYPHEFYDKFQRSRRSRARLSDTMANEIVKEQVSICKPVKFSPKLSRRERSSVANQENQELNTGRYSHRRLDTDRSDMEDSLPKKIAKKESQAGHKKEVHVHCKATNTAVVITDDSERQKLVIKGLRGWLVKKDDTCKTKDHKDQKQCEYTVGLQ